MKNYAIHCRIARVIGEQIWTVRAENEAEARNLFDEGKASFESEEMEVKEVEVEKIIEI